MILLFSVIIEIPRKFFGVEPIETSVSFAYFSRLQKQNGFALVNGFSLSVTFYEIIGEKPRTRNRARNKSVRFDSVEEV